jgi:hypothetical protein
VTRALTVAAVLAAAAVCAAAPIDDARRHYERLEYDQALVALDQERRDAAGDHARLAAAWLLEGSVDLALERTADARTAFARALRLSPSVRLPGDASPKLRARFAEAQAQYQQRARRHAAVRIALAPLPAPEVASRAVEIAAEVTSPFPGLVVQLSVADEAIGFSARLPMTARPDGRYAAVLPADFARPSARLALRAELTDEGELIAAPRGATACLSGPAGASCRARHQDPVGRRGCDRERHCGRTRAASQPGPGRPWTPARRGERSSWTRRASARCPARPGRRGRAAARADVAAAHRSLQPARRRRSTAGGGRRARV